MAGLLKTIILSQVIPRTQVAANSELSLRIRSMHQLRNNKAKNKIDRKMMKLQVSGKLQSPQIQGRIHGVEIETNETLRSERALKLKSFAAEYRDKIYSLLQSGQLGSVLSSLHISKTSINVEGSKVSFHWTLTEDSEKQSEIQDLLMSRIPAIRSKLQQLNPQTTLPDLQFVNEIGGPAKDITDRLSKLKIDMSQFDNSDLEQGGYYDTIRLTTHIYGLDRQEIIKKISSASSQTVTSFGLGSPNVTHAGSRSDESSSTNSEEDIIDNSDPLQSDDQS